MTADSGASADPVPEDVHAELTRVVRRWHQLPLDHARRAVPTVRVLLGELAGDRAGDLPDLGPAVLMDQLAVLVHDACASGRATGLAGRLATLRRGLP